MDPILEEEIRRYDQVTEKLITVLERQPQGHMVGSSTFHVNAGGVGVLITTGLAAFMAGLVFCLALAVFWQQKEISDLHDYLNVIYQNAPQLKQLVKKDVSDNHNQHAS